MRSYREFIREFALQEWWNGVEENRPLWVFCPICDKVLGGECTMNGVGHRECKDCKYEYTQHGSYAALVRINGEGFDLDDMFDDSEKMHQRIAELRNAKKIHDVRNARLTS